MRIRKSEQWQWEIRQGLKIVPMTPARQPIPGNKLLGKNMHRTGMEVLVGGEEALLISDFFHCKPLGAVSKSRMETWLIEKLILIGVFFTGYIQES